MSEHPVISVVMPIGGIDEFVPVQLDALAHQTFEQPWELVLSINAPGAMDDPLVNGPPLHPRCTLVVVDSSAVRSAAHARNAGAAAASAELMAFCDADDRCEPSWLAAIVASLATHDAVGGHLDETELSPAGQERWRPPATPGDNPSFLGHRYPVSANMALRTSIFREVGGFPEGYTRCEDIALGWALIDHGVELAFTPDAVVHYRHRPGLWTMVRQHHFYGVGMSEVLLRRGTPGADSPTMFAANAQRVSRRSPIHLLRRGAIATGRVRGILQERRTR